jgi:hypothetical protein
VLRFFLIAPKFVTSAPIRVPSTPQMYAKAKVFSTLGNSAKTMIVYMAATSGTLVLEILSQLPVQVLK